MNQGISKIILNAKGAPTKEYAEPATFSPTEIKNDFKAKEGCRVKGNLSLLRVPGNFYISINNNNDFIEQLNQENIKLNFSHRIQHVSFGSEKDLKQIKEKFNVGIFSPIDDIFQEDSEGSHQSFEYFLNVVPTEYITHRNEVYKGHQFISNNNHFKTDSSIISINFRYELSPMLVRITQQPPNPFKLFIQICGIVGGLYTLTSVILTFLINSTSLFFTKKEK